MVLIKRILAIVVKDFKSEYRTRYGISAIFLFVLTAITMLVFAMGFDRLNSSIFSGLMWTIMFFGSMTGLSKGFVREEERQTTMLLKLTSHPTAIYFGKLIYNLFFSIAINILVVVLFLFFFDELVIRNFWAFVVILLLGSVGLGSASTVISAIISKAGMKNSLFTVLSFPVLLPLIFVGIEVTAKALEGEEISKMLNDMQLLLAYSGILIPLSFIVFDMIWEE